MKSSTSPEKNLKLSQEGIAYLSPKSPNSPSRNKNKITFESLIRDYRVNSISSFANYLASIWKELARRSSDKKKGINRITFTKYYVLPGIISERLFKVLDIDENGFLDPKEFINGMIILFTESFNNIVKFIFNFYDFNHDGIITRDDVRLVLSYVPALKSKKIENKLLKKENENNKENNENNKNENEDEITKILNKSFNEKSSLNQDEFIDVIENKCSDILLFILLFILERRPFNNDTIKVFAAMAKNPTTSHISPALTNKIIVSPIFTTKLKSPALVKAKENLNQKMSENSILQLYSLNKNDDDDNEIKEKILPQSPSHLNRKIKLDHNIKNKKNSEIISFKNINNLNNENNEENNENNENNNEDKGFISPRRRDVRTPLPTKNFKSKSLFNLKSMAISTQKNSVPSFTSFMEKNKFNKNNKNYIETILEDDDENQHEKTNEISYSGYLYKIKSSGKLKKLFFKLIYKDIYYYKSESDAIHDGMHNLSNCFIKENEPFEYQEKKFFSFTLILPKKSVTYYCDNENEFKNWIKNLHIVLGYNDINEKYEINEEIGVGKFAKVFKGKNKKTGKIVAIKVFNKSDMNVTDYELVKTEMEVLKICQHPNIIKLFDINENEDNIYLIMELCKGSDLFTYIEKRGYKLPEKRTIQIINQLLNAIDYLNNYGIVHRDLKPENILMTEDSDSADMKLLDFGLSKIIGPSETCLEPFGTISYVAPEVLQEKPYDQKSDLWSVGIITYLLLCGCLPFDDENDEKEIARQTIQDPVPFYNVLWKNLSNEARDFVDRLLQKDPNKRMSVKEALNHCWIKNNKNNDMENNNNNLENNNNNKNDENKNENNDKNDDNNNENNEKNNVNNENNDVKDNNCEFIEDVVIKKKKKSIINNN